MPDIDIESLFTYHPTREGQEDRYNAIRQQAKQMAYAIVAHTRPCADQTAAIRKLREAVMTANAAIALEPDDGAPR